MDQIKKVDISALRLLIKKINHYRHEFYDNQTSIVSDEQYDRELEQLIKMEKRTNLIYSNSPNTIIQYPLMKHEKNVPYNFIWNKIVKATIIEEVKPFITQFYCIAFANLIGAQVILCYKYGQLQQAIQVFNTVTKEGIDVTDAIKTIEYVPLKIPYKYELNIKGIVTLRQDRFQSITCNQKDIGNVIRQNIIDPNVNVMRNNQYSLFVYGLVESLNIDKNIDKNITTYERIVLLSNLGFNIYPFKKCNLPQNCTLTDIKLLINQLQKDTEQKKLYMNGVIFQMNDLRDVHLRNDVNFDPSFLFLKYRSDEIVEVRVTEIEWMMGKKNHLIPIIHFPQVQVDGYKYKKLSLQYLYVYKDLNLEVGDYIYLIKENNLLKVYENTTKHDHPASAIPLKCPYCGKPTRLTYVDTLQILVCDNPDCYGKLIYKTIRYCEIGGANIRFPLKFLKYCFEQKWIAKIADLYTLQQYDQQITESNKIYEVKKNKLYLDIERSKNIDLANLFYALSINGVGVFQAKSLAQSLHTWDEFEYIGLSNMSFDFIYYLSSACNKSIHEWFKTINLDELHELLSHLHITNSYYVKQPNERGTKIFNNITFAVSETQFLDEFVNRNDCIEYIQYNGGQAFGEIRENTQYLISKDKSDMKNPFNHFAKKKKIPIISGKDLINLVTKTQNNEIEENENGIGKDDKNYED